MTLEELSYLPEWMVQALWSVIAVLTAYLIGRFVTRTVCQRFSVWVPKTGWKWDALIIDALHRGIPSWSLLLKSLFGILPHNGQARPRR